MKLAICKFLATCIVVLIPYQLCAESNCINIGVLAQFKKVQTNNTHRYGLEIINGVNAGIEFLKQQNNEICFNQINMDFGNTIANIPKVISNSKNTTYFIGLGLSHQVQVAMDVLTQTNSLLITPTAANNKLNFKGSRSIMMFPRNAVIAKRLAEYTYSKGIRKVLTVFAENSSSSQTSKNSFKREYQKLGGKIVGEFGIRRNEANLAKHLKKIRELDFSHAFLPLLELEATKSMSFFINNNLTSDFIGTNGWGNYYEISDKYLRDKEYSAIVPQLYDYRMKTSENVFFTNQVKEKQHVLPSHLGAFSFDAVLLLNNLIRACSDKLTQNIEHCIKQALPMRSSTGLIKEVQTLNLIRDIKINEFNNKRISSID